MCPLILNRRNFIRLVGGGIAISETMGFSAFSRWNHSAGAAETPPQPNIVLIMADDLGYGSLGCYGSKEISTPNIDRLARNGIRLTDFHSNGPMCSPTRASLLTGRYPQRCAWVDDAELSPVFREQRKDNMKQRWAWGISIDELTIADLIKKAGYQTALLGKWHLGYDLKFHPMNQGFDEFRGFIGGAVDYHTHVAQAGLKDLDWWNGKKIENEEGYTTDLLTHYAEDFIERQKNQPFFLYLSHAAPHVPLQGRDPRQGKSSAETYKEMTEVLDESVGRIEEALRKHHLHNKTLVIFCSDNGTFQQYGIDLSGGLRGEKGSLYEGGHRVPCILSWPGMIPAGSEWDAPVMTMDFFPTVAKLAGIKPPGDLEIDGMNLLPLMKGDQGNADRVLHWLFDDAWAVRKGPWKLIGKGRKAQELFNLRDDIGETNNIIAHEAEQADELMNLHREWLKVVGDK